MRRLAKGGSKARADDGFRLVMVGTSWPLQTFLRRLLDGLAADGLEVVLTGRGRRPRALPAAYGWRRLPELHRGRIARLVAVAQVVGKALWRAPRRTLRLVRRLLADRAGLAAVGRLVPHVGRQREILYFPWNSGAIDHLPLLDVDRGSLSVVSCRGSQVNVAVHDPARPRLADDLRRSFARVDRAHCVSAAIAREAVGLGLDPAKTTIIRPAVDVSVFSPPSTPSASPPAEGPPWRLVATGSLDWRKGFDDLLLAVSRVLEAGHDVHLDLLGDGPERQRLVFAAHDLEIADRVHFHGRVPPDRVLETLRAAHVFVLSSWSEGIANAALEAMACGLPVVSTAVGGMAEVIEDGVDGLLVPFDRPEALAPAIARLLDDRALARRIGAAARRTIVAHHDLDDQVRAFRSLLEALWRDGG